MAAHTGKITKLMGIGATGLLLAACSGVTSATTTADATNAANSDVVNIGGLWALTGDTSAYGVAQDNAVQLAVEQRNAEGGIDGREVVYCNFDNKGEPAESSVGMSYLVEQVGASVVVGPDTAGNTFAAQPIAESKGVTLVSASTTIDGATINPETDEVYDYFFRTNIDATTQGSAIATFSNQQGYETAAILKDNATDYGQNLATVYHEVFEGDVVIDVSYVSGDADFTSILTNVKAADVDVIFIAGFYQEAGTIIKQAREMGIDTVIVGPNGFANDNLTQLAGEANMDDVYYVANFVFSDDADQDVKDFEQAYTDKFGVKPDMYSALAFDAVNMIMDAIDRADTTDPAAIRDAIEATDAFDGIAYPISFDEDHNIVDAPVFIQEFQDGQMTDNTTIIDTSDFD
ncbi:branched-chain amino acid ABC transporter substrate-binding protein [Aerococcus agrisoli]|uniref:Branched-chain amino acid ABC transporter substrate-binding protein n=2 Tax=Aerococcus agrisoli TaxID=2487350 RepID=A0A3N4GPB1_9LACT|nr:branched-chain amino acid ABC transporter substrate-binding protein [Aerococcus agrisoli]